MATALDNEGWSIVRIEPEADKAARHKQALTNALLVAVAAAEDARRDGFEVNFGVNLDQYGRYALLPPVTLVKRY